MLLAVIHMFGHALFGSDNSCGKHDRSQQFYNANISDILSVEIHAFGQALLGSSTASEVLARKYFSIL
jgi:hypothetical protein